MVLSSAPERLAARPGEPGGENTLVVPLVAGDTTAQSRPGAIASGLLAPLAARFAVSVAPPSEVSLLESHLEEWLAQSPRLLLLPFGQPAVRELAALAEPLQPGLVGRRGEEVSRHAFPTPTGAVTRPIFAPLEGVACAETQLAPLLRLFPGWPDHYLCLSSSSIRLALLCCPAGDEEQGEAASAVLFLLETALGLRASRWKADGEILLSYIQSLVGAVLRGPALQCADTLQSYSPCSLLTPPWLRGGRAESGQ
jgi:hypothetical protein